MPASPIRPLSLSPRAIRDIAAIEAHYAQFSVATADRVLAAIKAAAEAVCRNSLIGPEGVRNGTRHKVVGRYPYTIVYRPPPGQDSGGARVASAPAVFQSACARRVADWITYCAARQIARGMGKGVRPDFLSFAE